MVFRKNIVLPSMVFTILVGWAYKGSIVTGIQAVFNAGLYAATQLFNVFLLIAIMVAMLKAASSIKADQVMIRPIQRLMINPFFAYVILVLATFVISLFFWPTPALPLVGALLIPAAVRVGLSPMTSAMAIAMAGQGMALAGDIVIQGAPKITATAAGVPIGDILPKGGLLTIVTGVIALGIGYIMQRREDSAFARQSVEERMRVAGMLSAQEESAAALETASLATPGKAGFIAVLIPVLLLLVIIAMITEGLKGGDATALLGGMGGLLLMIISVVRGGPKLQAFEATSDFLVDGFLFAFRAMGPVIPIAGFFFLGSSDGSSAILGQGAPGFLFDAAVKLGHVLPPGSAIAAFGVLILGMLTGLDGSGFAGLPLVGATAAALGGHNTAYVSMLGAVGQMGSVWTGGGTLIAWSTLVAVAGIAGVNALDLAKKNFIPVIVGLVASTVLAVILW
ncbi:MAG: hypothetical protein K6T30_00445 [Alicyclobacillus sp.]|nr:hypothetical protein [Alicyclobacillus sp.]